MKHWFAVALLLVACSCNRKPKPSTPPALQAADQGLNSLPSIPGRGLSQEPLVKAGEHVLTRGQLEQDLQIRVAAAGEKLPADRIDAFREQMTAKLIEQFVVRSLLLDEAARQKIEVTPADEQRAWDRIEGYLKSQGRTLDEALAGSPAGRERMQEEVRTGVTIDKLLANRLPQLDDPSDEDIRAFSEENKDRLHQPERVHARQILLAVDTNAEATVQDALRKKADELHEQLVNGASFEALARANSDHPSSARGGDLGWFRRGQLPSQFENVAFNLATGVISPVVQSPLGYHIMLVEEHEAEQEAPREKIVDAMKQRRRQGDLRELITSLLAKTQVQYSPAVSNLIPESVRP